MASVYGQVDGRARDLAFHFDLRADMKWIGSIGVPPVAARRREAGEAILLGAVAAAIHGGRGVSYSRRRVFYVDQRRYQGRGFTFDRIVPTVDQLADFGLIDNQIAAGRGPCGRQSTFRATPLLMAAAPRDLADHLRIDRRELVVLRDRERHPVPYHDTERTEGMRQNLLEVNRAIAASHLGLAGRGLLGNAPMIVGGKPLYPVRRSLYRIFNRDFGRGGRMYGGFWQYASEAVRQALLIDGEPVVELDYPELHARLVYALADRELVDAAYTIDRWHRKAVKKAFFIMLNAESERSALGAVAEKIGGTGAFMRARDLIAAIKRKHWPVADYFQSGIGLRLQRIDADIAETILMRLLRAGITALPIHDSFIVQRRHESRLQEAMDDALAEAIRCIRFRK